MFKKAGILALTLLVFAACEMSNKNPLMNESTLPFEAPPFDQIEASDFMPAFKKGMSKQLKEVDSIANNSENPTFENTLVALEKSGQLLTRVQHSFGILTSATINSKSKKFLPNEQPKIA